MVKLCVHWANLFRFTIACSQLSSTTSRMLVKQRPRTASSLVLKSTGKLLRLTNGESSLAQLTVHLQRKSSIFQIGSSLTVGSYFLHALNACLLRKWTKPGPSLAKAGGELGRMMILYALHTQIFEWRQSTSMINPSGMMGAFGASAMPVGEALRERRKGLVDGLDSYGECYLTSNSSISATLLQKLAYISLDVSLSDMHLVAGRSHNTNDTDFAEENLKHWANSDMANSTMAHVYSMLDLCHSCVNSGMVPDSSFEVAIGLFTGGIICWAYAKLKTGAPRDKYLKHMRNASAALTEMGCWRMCCMFGRILKSFEAQRTG